ESIERAAGIGHGLGVAARINEVVAAAQQYRSHSARRDVGQTDEIVVKLARDFSGRRGERAWDVNDSPDTRVGVVVVAANKDRCAGVNLAFDRNVITDQQRHGSDGRSN